MIPLIQVPEEPTPWRQEAQGCCQGLGEGDVQLFNGDSVSLCKDEKRGASGGGCWLHPTSWM